MCEFCKGKEFIALNDTVDYSGLEIAVSGSGILRARDYNFKEIFEKQDVISINYCPICGRKLGD